MCIYLFMGHNIWLIKHIYLRAYVDQIDSIIANAKNKLLQYFQSTAKAIAWIECVTLMTVIDHIERDKSYRLRSIPCFVKVISLRVSIQNCISQMFDCFPLVNLKCDKLPNGSRRAHKFSWLCKWIRWFQWTKLTGRMFCNLFSVNIDETKWKWKRFRKTALNGKTNFSIFISNTHTPKSLVNNLKSEYRIGVIETENIMPMNYFPHSLSFIKSIDYLLIVLIWCVRERTHMPAMIKFTVPCTFFTFQKTEFLWKND